MERAEGIDARHEAPRPTGPAGQKGNAPCLCERRRHRWTSCTASCAVLRFRRPAALLRIHNTPIVSKMGLRGEMCDRVAELDAKGIAPKSAAATLRAIENRFNEFGEEKNTEIT